MLKFYTETSMDPYIGGAYQFTDVKNHIVPLHTHDYFEIFLVTKGIVSHTINNTVERLPAGSLVFIRPSDKHTLTTHSNDTCQIINIIFSQQTFDRLIEYYGDAEDFETLLSADMPTKKQLSFFDSSLLATHLNELNSLYRANKFVLRSKLLFLLNELVIQHILSGNGKYGEDDSDVPSWLSQLCAEMKRPNNFSAGIERMEILSKKSRGHIYRSFKKYMNTTPSE